MREVAAEHEQLLKSQQPPTLTRQLTIQNNMLPRNGLLRQKRGGSDTNEAKLVRPGVQAELVLNNPIALAQGYVAQYKSSEVRRDRISRRMSDFRQIAKTRLDMNLRKQDSFMSQPGGRLISAGSRRNFEVPEREEVATQHQRLQNVTRGMREYNRKRAMRASQDSQRDNSNPVGAFLSLARQQGHHTRHDTVRRFLDKKDREEERNRGSPPATAISERSKGRPVTGLPHRSGSDNPPTPKGGKSGQNAGGFGSWRGEAPPRGDDDEAFRTIEFVPPAMSTRLFYGSQVAIEASDGSFLTASGPKGELTWMAHPKSLQASDTGASGNGNDAPDEEDDDEDDFDEEDEPSAHRKSRGGKRPSSAASKRGDPQSQSEGKSESHSKPQVVFTKNKYAMLFTLVNLHDPSYVGPVNAGDDVWLCIHAGAGQFSWKDGSIIGTRVSSGAMIDTVPVDRTQTHTGTSGKAGKSDPGTTSVGNAENRNGTQQASESDEEPIGSVLPILTYIPSLPGQAVHAEKSIDELFRDASNFERVQRMNRSATHLGQWRFGVASNQRLSYAQQVERLPIESDMHIYLEQDLAFLCTADLQDGGNNKTKARELAQADANSKEGSDPVKTMNSCLRKLPKKPLSGQYCVNRAGVFRVRVVQTKLDLRQGTAGAGHAKGENLLMRARVQLKHSELGRHGRHRYLPGLKSGKKFTKQLRRMRQRSELECDEAFLAAIEDVEPESKQQKYFYEMYQRSPLPSPTNADALEEALSPKRATDNLSLPGKTNRQIPRIGNGGPYHESAASRCGEDGDINSNGQKHDDDDGDDDDGDNGDDDDDDDDNDGDGDTCSHFRSDGDESHFEGASGGGDDLETDEESDDKGEDSDEESDENENDLDRQSDPDTSSDEEVSDRAAGFDKTKGHRGRRASGDSSSLVLRGKSRKDKSVRLRAQRHQRRSRMRRRSSARDFLDEIKDPKLRDFILARNSEPYKKRLEEYGGVVPWFDTVHNLRLQDFKLARDLAIGRRADNRGEGMTLLNRSGPGAMELKRQQREIARWMGTAIYRRLLEEDQRIKEFALHESKE
ncbi:Hypothetical Protein FCC1311_006752 [Hondaea fermentalgiana]|uniref:Uncharacterized protein n=1 Tax=Hondaea fermentalgiana TaxID=2315210 RepID=A0A2R5G0A8_9STRA|nr:Hypothetical Protein FCC1311_006752 [Hondaea fermentalgiana]|eukprot:GBG24457.1 Hypothetical Protein FCC1311_006752 [Hondaea fermentalgiana]